MGAAHEAWDRPRINKTELDFDVNFNEFYWRQCEKWGSAPSKGQRVEEETKKPPLGEKEPRKPKTGRRTVQGGKETTKGTTFKGSGWKSESEGILGILNDVV